MYVYKNHILFFIAVSLLYGISYAQSSVLSSGHWYKTSVSKSGVYKIDYNRLKQLGVDPATLDPRTLKMYSHPGGMFPQANADSRPVDLVENAIIVLGEQDGVFHSTDAILFYAEGPDKQHYNIDRTLFGYEQNVYADKNACLFTYGGSPGKRIQQAPVLIGGTPVSVYQDVIHHEKTLNNILKSGREWLGERFEINNSELSIPLQIEGVQPGTSLKLVSGVASASITDSFFTIAINNVNVGQQSIQPIPNSQYGLKARNKRDTLLLSSDVLGIPARSTHEIKYRFSKSGNSGGYGYLDFFTLTYTRKLAVYGDQNLFRSVESLAQPITNFLINNVNTNTQVWDVSDIRNSIAHTITVNNGTGSFSASSETIKEFVVFNRALTPEVIKKISNQNLHSLPLTNLLIITSDELKQDAERLARHRQEHSQMYTTVVTMEEVFNEFSGGRADVVALRDFARYVKKQYPSQFQYLLLFGKGSYDYKNTLRDNINHVFTYQSRNSFSPLETYSSDDFFGILEDPEGEWEECFVCNETIDIAVGRIPAKTATEAKNVVDKIIAYETNLSVRGNWQTTVAFVADDGDFNVHQSQANMLSNILETNSESVFTTEKIYLDSYPQQSRPAGQIAPDVTEAIKKTFKEGALIINYTGHGNEYVWAQEKILDELLVANLNNERLPFLVTATCEFGRHDDPHIVSVAEVALLKKDHGTIGLVTTTRPVNSSTNFELNQSFYNALLSKDKDRYKTIGEVFRGTKNNSSSGVANRNFSLLADPSMSLLLPVYPIVVDAIETTDKTDTLEALSVVSVSGRILKTDAQTYSDFNGILTATVFDKPTSAKTLGDENPPFNYAEWSSLLFKGQAQIKEGEFTFQFVVPKNISYAIGNGRINLFAISGKETAAGISSVVVGGSAATFKEDNTPPQIRAYINDTTFINGGVILPNATLLVTLADESGISTTNTGIGNNPVAVLDDEHVFYLNDYYLANPNTYTKGTIRFQLSDLTPGKHHIQVKVWDTHNNPAQAEIDFVVTEKNEIVIHQCMAYPNPFRDESTLMFTHNRAGDDLQAEVSVYGNKGERVLHETYSIENSPYQVILGSLKGNNFPTGLYLCHILVRSVATGKQAKATTKLILLN